MELVLALLIFGGLLAVAIWGLRRETDQANVIQPREAEDRSEVEIEVVDVHYGEIKEAKIQSPDPMTELVSDKIDLGFGDEPEPTAKMVSTSSTSLEIEATEEYFVQPIFFGTDRAADDLTKGKVRFGAGRADRLQLGISHISIPKKHDVGEIERPRALNLLLFKIPLQWETPEKHFTTLRCDTLSLSDFQTQAAARMDTAEAFKGTAFVFIHGFNVPFEPAMFRAAQMAYDLGFDGPVFAYSWPAVGSTFDYVKDMDSATQAAPHLDAFLEHVLQTPGVERVHLLAHSMGNALLSEWVRRVGTKLQARTGKSIDQLILAAPDIDRSLFFDVAEHFTKHAQGVTLYANKHDRALLASEKIRGDFARAGDVPKNGPVVHAGIDTIDVSALGTGVFSLNHSAYAEERGVLDDVGQLLRTGLRPPPARMPTLRPVETPKGTYWEAP